MKKKLISENNPQGVEYPEAVTVDGKLVSAIDIEKGSAEWEGVKFYFPGCEGDAEEEMLFIQRKHKKGFTNYFRHRPGYIGDRNEPDRYLHNYAELRIKERFDKSLTSGEFPVQYYVVEKCPHCSDCKLKGDLKCNGEPKAKLITYNLRKIYDTCSIEKGADKYIADLLLTNSQNDSIKPMFLEVFVTHKCTEEKKTSGYPIIEIKINQKEDADNEIIENAGEIVDEYLFMKSENQNKKPPVVFYGFKREEPFNDYIQYANFTLSKQENELIGDCKALFCKDVESYAPENRALSFSVPLDEIKTIELYELGMAKAQAMGLKVRDCSICSQYKRPFVQTPFYTFHPCLLKITYTYKDSDGNERQARDPYVYQMPYRCNGFDKSKQAAGCQRYSIDKRRISNLVRSFEKMHKLFWVDESLLPPKPKPAEKPQPVNQPEQKQPVVNIIVDKPVRKLLTPQECFDCPIYRANCGHCLGAEEKDGRRYVVCDYQKPE